jgi:hypothetical protein
MALDRRRIWFNSVLGGIGGLLGWAWAVHAPRLLSPDASIYLKDAFSGMGIGAAIGLALGCTEGLVDSPSIKRTLLGGFIGGLIGTVGGAGGLALGEWVFDLAGNEGIWPRALGWALFGLFVGMGDGIARRMPARIRYGMIGGLIGGLIGGSVFERLLILAQGGNRAVIQAWSGASGLIILGICIGAMVGLVESLLRVAWLTFLNGRFEGQSRTIDPSRAVTTLGASDMCNIIVRGNRAVADVHAEIIVQDGEFLLRPRNGPVVVDRGGPLPVAASYPLRSGDRIALGSIRLVFQAEARKS